MSLTSSLYKLARLSATGRAVRKGRVPQRAANVAIGRGVGRATRKLWR